MSWRTLKRQRLCGVVEWLLERLLEIQVTLDADIIELCATWMLCQVQRAQRHVLVEDLLVEVIGLRYFVRFGRPALFQRQVLDR